MCNIIDIINVNCSAKFGCRIDFLFSVAFYRIILHEELTQLSHIAS